MLLTLKLHQKRDATLSLLRLTNRQGNVNGSRKLKQRFRLEPWLGLDKNVSEVSAGKLHALMSLQNYANSEVPAASEVPILIPSPSCSQQLRSHTNASKVSSRNLSDLASKHEQESF